MSPPLVAILNACRRRIQNSCIWVHCMFLYAEALSTSTDCRSAWHDGERVRAVRESTQKSECLYIPWYHSSSAFTLALPHGQLRCCVILFLFFLEVCIRDNAATWIEAVKNGLLRRIRITALRTGPDRYADCYSRRNLHVRRQARDVVQHTFHLPKF